ncbi:hypothetical protein CBR_g17821 [Chara braunii]|uniref:RNA polymerase sigma-70 domain-containing protein n=1 Tax=Chara braunii TaxID=69332 RepID=A0A388KVL8_CHABU|nr:hypothetical protein CBR_g17821 [Chara braunii]|eukprot:GBG74109.1 hypothetical protein CBR_g17821 [Chara braunii]
MFGFLNSGHNFRYPQAQVLIASTWMAGDAKEWLLAVVTGERGDERVDQWTFGKDFERFLGLVRSCYKDKTRDVTTMGQLMHLDLTRWFSVDALVRNMDNILAVPGVDYSDAQAVHILLQCLPVDIKKQLLERHGDMKAVTYHSRKDEALDLEARSRQAGRASTGLRYAHLKRGKYFEGKKIIAEDKKQSHLMVIYDDGTLEELDHSGLLPDSEDSSGSQQAATSGGDFTAEDVCRLLSVLDPREREILRLHYGVGTKDGMPMTLENISHRYGVSRERVRQVETAAMRKLQLRTRKMQLDQYLHQACT